MNFFISIANLLFWINLVLVPTMLVVYKKYKIKKAKGSYMDGYPSFCIEYGMNKPLIGLIVVLGVSLDGFLCVLLFFKLLLIASGGPM